MRIMGLALTGTTLALAGILAVGVADTASAKAKKHPASEASTPSATANPPGDFQESHGKLYRSKSHKAKKPQS